MAYTAKFLEQLDRRAMSRRAEIWVRRVGRVGLAAHVWFGHHVPGAPMPAQDLFNEQHTAPKQVSEGALGTQPPFVGVYKLLA
jgi:hypothetical protein